MTSSLENAISILSCLSSSIDLSSIFTVEPDFDPPPRVAAGVACVYLLEIQLGAPTKTNSFYIGETENLADRLKSHRQRFCEEWLKMVVFPLSDGGRSEARSIEARGIVALQRSGFSLQNVAS